MAQDLDTLIKLGGREWKSADGRHHRVYFNRDELFDLVGLRLERYKTGNIKFATLRDGGISNSRARELVGVLETGKFWYDLTDDKWHWKFHAFSRVDTQRLAEDIIDELKRRAAALETAA